MISTASPWITGQEIKAVESVMRTGMLANGDIVQDFEREFAEYCATKHAIATNNGTSALHASLLALGIGAGDEVIVPDFTFIATATAVSMCGARPVFADVDLETYTIDPQCILEAITPKTRALIGVHLFGHPFDLDAVGEICDSNHIYLIEDCAQAHGAKYNGKRVGGSGISSCFSFYPTKNMTTGEGGMITTNDSELAAHLRRIINHGQTSKYLHTELGYNYRMTNIQGAIGKVQLQYLEEMNSTRKSNAQYLSDHLKMEGLSTPSCSSYANHVYHQYVVRLGEDFPMQRDDLIAFFRDKNIGTAIHYPLPIHSQPLYRMISDSCNNPISDELSQTVLSLPVHPKVSREDCGHICSAFREAI